LEREIKGADTDIHQLNDQLNRLEREKIEATRDYERHKQRSNENSKTISQLEGELSGVEKEVKHLKSMNDTYRNEMINGEKNYQAQLRKNMGLKADTEKLDSERRYDILT
jgi:chromosome segregation ATPase